MTKTIRDILDVWMRNFASPRISPWEKMLFLFVAVFLSAFTVVIILRTNGWIIPVLLGVYLLYKFFEILGKLNLYGEKDE